MPARETPTGGKPRRKVAIWAFRFLQQISREENTVPLIEGGAMEYVEKLPGWLRWVLLPFACVLATIVVSIAARLFFWLQARMIGLGDGAWLELITNSVIAGGLTGYATVHVGCLVAPSNRRAVSLVVGGVVVMLSGLSIFLMLARHQWWGAAGVLATAIGAGIAIYSTFEEEEAKARWAALKSTV
jgi:hypothetical protein